MSIIAARRSKPFIGLWQRWCFARRDHLYPVLGRCDAHGNVAKGFGRVCGIHSYFGQYKPYAFAGYRATRRSGSRHPPIKLGVWVKNSISRMPPRPASYCWPDSETLPPKPLCFANGKPACHAHCFIAAKSRLACARTKGGAGRQKRFPPGRPDPRPRVRALI